MQANILYKNLEITSIDSRNAFNFIRLICCLIVIYEHCVVLTDIPFSNLNFRGVAVSIFFALSGFWVTKSCITSVSLKDFFVKRCKRILPLYYGTIIATVLLLSLFSVLPLKEYFTNINLYKYLFANVLN